MGEETTKTETKYTESKWTHDDFSILKEKNGVMQIEEESKGYKKILVGYKNSDALSYYTFNKIGGQWYLTRIDG